MSDTKANHSESIQNLEEAGIVSNNVESIESNKEAVLEEPEVATVATVAATTDESEEESATEESEEEPEVAAVEEPVAVDNLNQRIAELDYLRECCGNWVGSGRVGKSNFLAAWENKSVSIDSSINYDDKLGQLEKLPEIVKLWADGKVKTNSNHFKNIESYTLSKSIFNDKRDTEKVEVLEKLITLLLDCANGKMKVNQIDEVIDSLY